MPAVLAAPAFAEAQPQRVRVVRSVKQFGIPRYGGGGGKIKDDHGVAGEDFVHVELLGGKVLQGGRVHKDGDLAAVVEAQP